jgi:chemotaxis protein CheZ
MVDVWGGLETFRDYYAAIATAERTQAVKLHGPKLDGDEGHATQAHVDALFARIG